MAEVRNDLRHTQRFFNLLKLPTCIYGVASGIQERLAFLPRRAGCALPSPLRIHLMIEITKILRQRFKKSAVYG